VHTFQEEFKKENIIFECWGIGELEAKLKYRYSIVKRHFSASLADDFSFRLGVKKNELAYKPVKDYLERDIFTRNKNEQRSFQFFGIDAIDPMRLFDKLHETSKKICLVSDPYQGKSSLLKQLAYSLFSEPNETIPLS
jgi:hypothetical protein